MSDVHAVLINLLSNVVWLAVGACSAWVIYFVSVRLPRRRLWRLADPANLTVCASNSTNTNTGAYWYPILDGFPVPDEGIRIEPIPKKTHTIILASDGYPILKESLESSEQALHQILEADPLLFRTYKATKGVQEGNLSYDDRAYMKLRLRGEHSENVFKRNDSSKSTAKQRGRKQQKKKGR